VWRDGWRKLRSGAKAQRYICRSCGFRFSESAVQLKVEVDIASQSLKKPKPVSDVSEDVFSGLGSASKESLDGLPFFFREDVTSQGSSFVTTVEQGLNSLRHNSRDCRVCVSEDGMKNLAKVEIRKRWAAGATTDAKSIVFGYAWWLKKEGYRKSTIGKRTRILKRLISLGADVFNPGSVKEAISKQDRWNDNTKLSYVDAYTAFLRSKGLTWNPPVYKETRTLPFIPTEKELNQPISCCGPKTATFLQLLKETAVRAGEAHSLEWKDVDQERRTITVTPEKHSNPRILTVSGRLIAMINALNKGSNKVFGEALLGSIRATFCASRRRAARKLQNPRPLEIHFHTLRHWKATTLYHETKDILYVMNFLGHRSVQNTMKYIQIEQSLFREDSDGFICKIAKTVEEAKDLIECGFDYVTEIDGLRLFRKRK